MIYKNGTFDGQTTTLEMEKYYIKKSIKKLGVGGIIAYSLSFIPIVYYIFGIKNHTFGSVLEDFMGIGTHTIAASFALLGIITNAFCSLTSRDEDKIGEEDIWCRACEIQTERFLHSYGNCGVPISIGDQYYTDKDKLRMMSVEDRIVAAKKDFEIYADYMLQKSIEFNKTMEGDKYVKKPEIKLHWDNLILIGFIVKCPKYPW